MSLRELNPRTRHWLLLRVLGLHAPAARCASSAVVMDSLGLVVGTRCWLGHFSEAVREAAGVLGTASIGDLFRHPRP